MKLFLQHYADRVTGTLSGFDRLLLHGSLRMFSYREFYLRLPGGGTSPVKYYWTVPAKRMGHRRHVYIPRGTLADLRAVDPARDGQLWPWRRDAVLRPSCEE
jgi:hypothetical protein